MISKWTTDLGDLECLDLSRMPDMWATTEIDQWATPIHGSGRCRDSLCYQPHFKLVILKSKTSHTVKQYIIGEDLFGEIGEIINFVKISSRQLKKNMDPNHFLSMTSPN